MSKMTRTVLFTLFAVAVPSVAFAATGDDNAFTAAKYAVLAAGLGIGLAAFGGALAQGKAAAAALEGIARNPSASGKMLTPMILGLALIESLVIYALVIAFMALGTAGDVAGAVSKAAGL